MSIVSETAKLVTVSSGSESESPIDDGARLSVSAVPLCLERVGADIKGSSLIDDSDSRSETKRCRLVEGAELAGGVKESSKVDRVSARTN